MRVALVSRLVACIRMSSSDHSMCFRLVLAGEDKQRLDALEVGLALSEIADVLDEIRSEYPVMDYVERRLREVLVSQSAFMKEISDYLLAGRGKRIRPTLVVLATELGAADSRALVDAASAVELVHLASLIHDDIIDESGIRRGRPTIGKRWGNLVAVLAGDFLFASAFGLLASRQEQYSLRVLADAVKTMCEGEIEQSLSAGSNNLDEDAYLSSIGKKTASLIGASCQIGAHLAGASSEQVTAMQEYGLNLGYAFQIVDDLLDIWGSEEKTGKPMWLDLRRGLPTLPIIRLVRRGESGQAVLEMIDQLRGSGRSADGDIAELVQGAMMEAGIMGESRDQARVYAERAVQRLESLPMPARARRHFARLALAVANQV